MALIQIDRNMTHIGRKPKRRVRYIRIGGIHIHRFHRQARFSHEWHNYGGTRYFNFGIGSPTVHARWAFSCTIYLP